jgi:quercetin dioxygenase-like cupin family protein
LPLERTLASSDTFVVLTRHKASPYPVNGSQKRATADFEHPATAVGGTAMKSTAALVFLVSLAAGTLAAQDVTVRSLVSKDLSGVPGRELSMITVEYPPGGADPVHTHHAQALVYVLEGSIVMQVKGGPPTTLGPGQTFYEGPDDVHIVGRNASRTAPARFLVFLVKDKGAPILTPVK